MDSSYLFIQEFNDLQSNQTLPQLKNPIQTTVNQEVKRFQDIKLNRNKGNLKTLRIKCLVDSKNLQKELNQLWLTGVYPLTDRNQDIQKKQQTNLFEGSDLMESLQREQKSAKRKIKEHYQLPKNKFLKLPIIRENPDGNIAIKNLAKSPFGIHQTYNETQDFRQSYLIDKETLTQAGSSLKKSFDPSRKSKSTSQFIPLSSRIIPEMVKVQKQQLKQKKVRHMHLQSYEDQLKEINEGIRLIIPERKLISKEKQQKVDQMKQQVLQNNKPKLSKNWYKQILWTTHPLEAHVEQYEHQINTSLEDSYWKQSQDSVQIEFSQIMQNHHQILEKKKKQLSKCDEIWLENPEDKINKLAKETENLLDGFRFKACKMKRKIQKLPKIKFPAGKFS